MSSLKSIEPMDCMHTVQCTLYTITENSDPLSPPYVLCTQRLQYTECWSYMKTTVLHQSMSDLFMEPSCLVDCVSEL